MKKLKTVNEILRIRIERARSVYVSFFIGMCFFIILYVLSIFTIKNYRGIIKDYQGQLEKQQVYFDTVQEIAKTCLNEK